MSKRPSLAESMKSVTPGAGAVESKPYFAATRFGKKRITLLVDPAEHKRLKHLAVEIERSIEDIMKEALDDWLAQYPELDRR
jgi:hypothetical protein